jgi:hypothetical protein
MHQVREYKVEEKLHLGVRYQKRLNTTGLEGPGHFCRRDVRADGLRSELFWKRECFQMTASFPSVEG